MATISGSPEFPATFATPNCGASFTGNLVRHAVDSGATFLTELVRRGYSITVAEQYLTLIGDTPELTEDGRWIVRGQRGYIVDIIAPVKRDVGWLEV